MVTQGKYISEKSTTLLCVTMSEAEAALYMVQEAETVVAAESSKEPDQVGDNDEEEEEDEDSLEKLQEEIARMEEEAARLSKETEQISGGAAGGESSDPASATAAADSSSTGKQQPARDACSVYVGQVDYSATPEELLAHFGPCGTVERVTIVCDKFTGKPKGKYAEIPYMLLLFL